MNKKRKEKLMGTSTMLSEFKKIQNFVKDTLTQIWLPYHILRQQIEEILKKTNSLADAQVIISGETTNITLYLLFPEWVLIHTPLERITNNSVYQESAFNSEMIAENEQTAIFAISGYLTSRLNLPKVALINPAVKDVFPVPRLCLGVGYIAAYLRKRQIADVRIFDMQLNLSLEQLFTELKEYQADINGISINFGQYDLACEIIDWLFTELPESKFKIAGNIIAAFAHQALISYHPKLLVCKSEGEYTMEELVKQVNQAEVNLQQVPGIYYQEDQVIKETEVRLIDMDNVPLTAMDTVSEIIANNGALTMEMSRGCFHSACTFCPRNHKRKKWQGMSPATVLFHLIHYQKIFKVFNYPPRIFFADEEFIGWREHCTEDLRIQTIMGGIEMSKMDFDFDQDTRIDQIYDPNKDKQWHLKRMETLQLCVKGGLDRLLVGVESGSDSVLLRYNKQIKAEHSIMALRILTALNIGLRITFITFDQLMNFQELEEDINFLERDDVYLQPLENISFEELYQGIHDPEFVMQNTTGQKLYTQIAYMVVTLEPLFNSTYIELLKKAEQRLNLQLINPSSTSDYNMARLKANFVDPDIGMIAHYCQAWIDRNFAIDYTLKGFYKTASTENRPLLFQYRARYRGLSMQLLKCLSWLFNPKTSLDCPDEKISDFKSKINDKNKTDIIMATLEILLTQMETLINDIQSSIESGQISDKNNKQSKAIQSWYKNTNWSLIN